MPQGDQYLTLRTGNFYFGTWSDPIEVGHSDMGEPFSRMTIALPLETATEDTKEKAIINDGRPTIRGAHE